ncbi:MAG: hypothetical protein ACLR1T_14590 [Evtepia gabavorous]
MRCPLVTLAHHNAVGLDSVRISCVRRPRWTRRRNCCWISPPPGEPAENPRC